MDKIRKQDVGVRSDEARLKNPSETLQYKSFYLRFEAVPPLIAVDLQTIVPRGPAPSGEAWTV